MNNNSLPTISVLMSVYNDSPHLEKAVESILNQSYPNFEFIIINDGSTDGSLELLKNYAQQDERIKLFDEPNKGLTEELQFALQHVRGKYIARMDGDDIAHPDRFEHQIEFMTSNPEIICSGTNVMFIDEDSDPLGESEQETQHDKIEEQLYKGRGGAIFHPTMMAKTSAIKKVGGYDTRYRVGQDLDLFFRLGEIGRLANSTEVTLKFRRSFKSTTTLESKKAGLKRRKEIIKEACDRRGETFNGSSVTVTAADSLIRYHLSMSEKAANNGYRRSSIKHLFKTFKTHRINIEGLKKACAILKKNF